MHSSGEKWWWLLSLASKHWCNALLWISYTTYYYSARQVDFDDQSPQERLQVLNDVVESLNVGIKTDIRATSSDQLIEHMLQFLLMHKCKQIPMTSEEARIEWIESLRKGEKKTVYPLLHWVLSNYENLKKRSYLANYLMPIDLPSEYLMERSGNLVDLLDAYKELQSDFEEVHKQ